MSGKRYEKKRANLDLSRRYFLKTAAVAGLSVAITGQLAKRVSSLVLDDVPRGASPDYILKGDRIMTKRKYVLMTEAEKRTLVRTFTVNYKKQL